MLSVRAVRFQNFFSFGNQLTEVRFDAPGPTLVVGKNGAGKSVSILDSVVYGLYGKPYRKTKMGQMLNSITGRDLLVEVDLEARGKSWTIRRGQKPNLFEVYRDGELVDQAASVRDQQEWLERSVLMMDHRSFTQTVILGSAGHVPFMQLPAGQRREVIEDILDIQVFSRMNEVLRERAGELRTVLAEREKELAVAQRELEVEERHLAALARDVEAERRETEQSLESARVSLTRAEAEIMSLRDESLRLNSTVSDVNENRRRISELETLRDRLGVRRRQVQKEIDFFSGSSECPTCSRGIDDEFREAALSERRAQLERVEGGLESTDRYLGEAEARASEIGAVFSEIASLDRRALLASQGRDGLVERVRGLEERLLSLTVESRADEALIDDVRRRVDELSSLRDESLADARVMAHAGQLLKDGGIKARIVRQYVPLMNRLINRYLASLELFVDFHLDENFVEEIRSRHRDTFSYENFSEGERLRIDLAILFAWRDIARMRNSSSVDLLIFDEILDSALDSEGIDYLLRLITSMTDGSSVVIISHREGMEDKFPRVLSFSKRQNFSLLTETRRDDG